MAPQVKRRLNFPLGSSEEEAEIENLERGLTPPHHIESILFSATFEESEDGFIKYRSVQWALYSLLLVLALGIGLFMFLYLPVRRYILRKDIRSRKLYLTPEAIVYKVSRPEPFPFLGNLIKEKYIPLASVADVVVEQGYLQSLFGVYSLRIENLGVRRPASDDVQIEGIVNPNEFRKAVLMRTSHLKSEASSRKQSKVWVSPSKAYRSDASGSFAEVVVLQKLEDIETSIKRVNNLIGEKSQTYDL